MAERRTHTYETGNAIRLRRSLKLCNGPYVKPPTRASSSFSARGPSVPWCLHRSKGRSGTFYAKGYSRPHRGSTTSGYRRGIRAHSPRARPGSFPSPSAQRASTRCCCHTRRQSARRAARRRVHSRRTSPPPDMRSQRTESHRWRRWSRRGSQSLRSAWALLRSGQSLSSGQALHSERCALRSGLRQQSHRQ